MIDVDTLNDRAGIIRRGPPPTEKGSLSRSFREA